MDHYSVAFLWVVITNGPSVYSFVVDFEGNHSQFTMIKQWCIQYDDTPNFPFTITLVSSELS